MKFLSLCSSFQRKGLFRCTLQPDPAVVEAGLPSRRALQAMVWTWKKCDVPPLNFTKVGWWLGTFSIFPNPNWETHIFQRGRDHEAVRILRTCNSFPFHPLEPWIITTSLRRQLGLIWSSFQVGELFKLTSTFIHDAIHDIHLYNIYKIMTRY